MLPQSWRELTADTVPDDDVVEALGIIGSIRESLHARLILSAAKPEPQTNTDRLLTADEVAERLGMSRRWVYDHADKLPGFRRIKIGTDRRLRFRPRR